MADRIRADELAHRLAQSKRKIQEMAAQGLIPSAAKIGSIWTFNPDAIDQWIKSLETHQEKVAGAASLAIGVNRDVAPASDLSWKKPGSLYEQLMAGRRKKPVMRRAALKATPPGNK